MTSSKPVGIWIRVSTEDRARGESSEHHEKRAWFYAEPGDVRSKNKRYFEERWLRHKLIGSVQKRHQLDTFRVTCHFFDRPATNSPVVVRLKMVSK